jgi:hypothetical protein
MMAVDTQIGHLARTYFALERAATALVALRVQHAALLVVVRPDQPDATVISHDDHVGLRSAVRVAAAAGNDRAWRGVQPVIERFDVARLPGVIHLAAKRDRTRMMHIAGIHSDERLVAVAMWFSRRESDSATAVAYRHDTFAVLQAAVQPGSAHAPR